MRLSHSELLTKYRGTPKCKYPLECGSFKFDLIFTVFISYCHHSWLTGQCGKRGTFLNGQLSCLLEKLLSSPAGSAVEKHVVPQDLVWELPRCPAGSVSARYLSFCGDSSRHWVSVWPPPCCTWGADSTSDSWVSFYAEIKLQVQFIEKGQISLSKDVFCFKTINSKNSFAI